MRLRTSMVIAISVAMLLSAGPPISSAARSQDELRILRAETVPGHCDSYGTGESEPVNFIDQGGPERVRLLLDRTVIRPGEQLRLAPRNLSQRPISYGLQTAATQAGTGRRLPGTGLYTLLIGLTAAPGEVGPCATLSIPNTARLGQYRAILEGVDGGRLSDANLKAPFAIAGEPLNPGPYVRAGVRSVGPRVDGELRARRINRAADRIAKILRPEPANSWGVGHRSRRQLDVEITELTVKGFERIKRVAKVPVRVLVASGP